MRCYLATPVVCTFDEETQTAVFNGQIHTNEANHFLCGLSEHMLRRHDPE